MSHRSYTVAAVMVLALAPHPAAAQGTLEGTVRSVATGATLPGARVGIPTLNLGALADPDGHYEVTGIPAGTHTVEVSLIGYTTEVREVTIADGRSAHLDVELHESALALEGLVAVGSRARPRTATQSAVPIDAITARDFVEQGDTDLNDLLRTVIPSFNVNPQAVGDAARIIRPASLRGLAPDHTLVLINGKRRHRASIIMWIGGGFADGAQGPDISAIPAIALRQVEILRDGASAQYGSDAIAGVMNLTLKDAPSGGSFAVRTGTYWEGDGESYTLSGNIGLPLGRNGFANLSAEYGASNPTSRSVQRADAAALIAAGNTHVRDPAQIWGAHDVDNDLKLWGNFGRFFGDGLQLYGHANYASETVTGGFFYRNPNTRAGVYSIDGGRTLLVGDVLDAEDGVLDGSAGCPVVEIVDHVPDPVALARVLKDPNCFTFQEMFKGGFTPQFGGDARDASMVAGLRGDTRAGLQWDVSGGFGQHLVDFFIYNTVNASLGPQSPDSFDPGVYAQTEYSVNADISYRVNGMVNVAGGAEFRDEHFEIGIGETASWEIGPFAAQGFSSGSNGFPGFSDIAAGGWHRTNFAAYGDLEARARDDRWTLGGAARIERFEDFGTTANWKLAGRYGLTSALAVRGSASTGFRAPTPGQQNAFNVSTQFDRDLQELVNNGTIPSTSPVAAIKGGRPLNAEKSVNASLGTVVDAGAFSLSADYFRVAVSDRLALSRVFALTEAEAEQLISEGITSAKNLANFRFFTNEFDTRTQGVDVVASFVPGGSGGDAELSLAFNHTRTRVTEYNPDVLNETRIKQLEDALPGTRWTAAGRRGWGGVSVLGRLSYYAGWFDSRDDRSYPGEYLVDLEAHYAVTESAMLTIGAQNALNRYPEENPEATRAGNRYSPGTPFGASGGFYYVKAGIRW
ncbi:MAG: TonB-dependent receptor [Gemmatimonadetes bacterium]|nr:TonB-dependent receptor [Gemmatimonadota bacterium]MYK64909.1 TonB-dependent receptor [Gemmatimonadota bacterium]